MQACNKGLSSSSSSSSDRWLPYPSCSFCSPGTQGSTTDENQKKCSYFKTEGTKIYLGYENIAFYSAVCFQLCHQKRGIFYGHALFTLKPRRARDEGEREEISVGVRIPIPSYIAVVSARAEEEEEEEEEEEKSLMQVAPPG